MAQNVEVIQYPDLDDLIYKKSDEIKVINFWATWCKPCVAEIPHFEAVNQKYKDEGLKVYLISFDFPSQLDKKVKKFINKKNIKSIVKLLDETDYNAFIDKVDNSWSGAIPATLIVDGRTGRRSFYEKSFSLEELETEIQKFLN
ncbi:MAG TPA: TlpA disulfide reductase family protein [Cyclobacteriaceae bacterium]